MQPPVRVHGPKRAHLRRCAVGELGIGEAADELEREILREHGQWRDVHLDAWMAGVPSAPEPPYAELETFAMPA